MSSPGRIVVPKMPLSGVTLSAESLTMRTHLIRLVTSATFALCLLSGTAMAQSKGHDKDKDKDKYKDKD